MTARAPVAFCALVLAAGLVATGCASTTRGPSDRAVEVLEATPTPTTVAPAGPTTTSTTLPNPCQPEDPTRSYRPSTLPPPGVAPAGAWADKIRAFGKLRVGVDENTEYFSFKDPITGRITGFEADMAREIARVIFPGVTDIDTKIKFVTVTTSQKFDVVTDNKVDLTIDVATVGCGRWGFVDFTSPYYQAQQQIMVRTGSSIENQDGLADKRVCVTSPSSSQTFMETNIPTAHLAKAETRTGCLTLLQENEVDAIVLPSSIQAGLAAQDPNMTLLPGPLRGSPKAPADNVYGIAVNKSNTELTRFVNALLEQWRRNDTLRQLQDDNLPQVLRQAAPEARYLD